MSSGSSFLKKNKWVGKILANFIKEYMSREGYQHKLKQLVGERWEMVGMITGPWIYFTEAKSLSLWLTGAMIVHHYEQRRSCSTLCFGVSWPLISILDTTAYSYLRMLIYWLISGCWPYLYPWDKSTLIMVYDPSNELLNLVCQYFVEDSCICVHQGYWPGFFSVVSLSEKDRYYIFKCLVKFTGKAIWSWTWLLGGFWLLIQSPC